MSYEVRDTSPSEPPYDLLERVVYEYDLDGPGAGNVRRVKRMIPDAPGPNPADFTVYATEMFYSKQGEVQVISLREWREEGGLLVGNITNHAIREFRGSGRQRTMIRQRDPVTLAVLSDTAWWTWYDGDAPRTV